MLRPWTKFHSNQYKLILASFPPKCFQYSILSNHNLLLYMSSLQHTLCTHFMFLFYMWFATQALLEKRLQAARQKKCYIKGQMRRWPWMLDQAVVCLFQISAISDSTERCLRWWTHWWIYYSNQVVKGSRTLGHTSSYLLMCVKKHSVRVSQTCMCWFPYKRRPWRNIIRDLTDS